MQCTHCGKQLPDDAKYCLECGIPINKDNENIIADPYWDSVLPEINDELKQIPKDIIAKGIGIVVAVALAALFLIFMP